MLALACAGRGTSAPVGASDKHTPGRAGLSGADGGFVDGASALPPDYRAKFAKVNKARFVSQGHAAGRWDVDVWANETAQRALAARSREVPAGAVVVEEHHERGPEGGPADGGTSGPVVMVMEKMPAGYAKEHGDWRYAVVGSQGQLVRNGVVDSCAGCHDDAPMDGFFPIVE